MKTLKRITSALFATVLVLTSIFVSSFTASAASSVSITPNGTTIDYSKNISVRISISADAEIFNIDSSLSYNASQLQFLSADGCELKSSGNGKVEFYDENFDEGEKSASYTIRFKALTTGDFSVSYSGTVTKIVNNLPQQENVTGKAGFTASDPSAANADLSALTVSSGSLSPRFSAASTNYNITVANSVKQITVNATSASSGATVNGTGNVSLEVGDNKHTVTVTAKDGKTTKTYTLNIHRRTEEEENAATQEPDNEPDQPSDDPNNETPAVDQLLVQVSGKEHHILTTIPEGTTAPKGFNESTTSYNGIDVPVFASENDEYVLYILKNDQDDSTDYYTYDSNRDEFILLPYMIVNDRMFIFAYVEEYLYEPLGYTSSTTNLGNSAVKVFCSENPALSDFCIFYCYIDGDYKFYRYDLIENTVQRAPDFELLSIHPDTPSEEVEKPANWLEAFRRISVAGKVIIFTVIIAVLCIIAILVLLIIRAVGSRDPQMDGVAFEPEDSFEDFDDISEIDSFDLLPETPNEASQESNDDKSSSEDASTTETQE